jgi:pullulanase/glycogen debranching enzyme
MRVWPGRAYPLGATWDGQGVNFALFSENATAVDLCLFEHPKARQENHRIRLPERTDQIWHGYLPEIRPGQYYGYRVHGPYEPQGAIASIRPNVCSIPMRRRFPELSSGRMPCSAIVSAILKLICP